MKTNITKVCDVIIGIALVVWCISATALDCEGWVLMLTINGISAFVGLIMLKIRELTVEYTQWEYIEDMDDVA